MTVLYTASATAVGGRLGRVVSSDNVLDLDLKTPKELGGPGGYGTNPEQLFAAGYSACFDSALNLVIKTQRVKEVTSTAVTANVSIFKGENNGFKLSVELEAEVEGVDKETAQKLVEAAHQVCPYSNATRGNIEVTLKVV
ncbi:organic hydroperoxide resistance protein [Rummeliibacillus sp. G93]|uniref:organic hydroperoxide resistance protein n=1 Tax=unclassified Rummeliibacillus TaxID=2622809 RepID=UPI00201CA3E5|nr:organic hydroperoxide resistance protein [Rummeliibacillus sp. G93]UQW97408.1 organic hydroperoxide resistance protein [Rummeliibacillus sp. G93]